MRRIVLLIVIMAALPVSVARADAPPNEDWRTSKLVPSIPFSEAVDLTDAQQDGSFGDTCVPGSQLGGSRLNPRPVDVWYRLRTNVTTDVFVVAEQEGFSPWIGEFEEGDDKPVRRWCERGTRDDPTDLSARVPAGQTLLFQVTGCANCADRTIDVNFVAYSTADVRVEELSATRVFATTPAGEVPVVNARDISFELSNAASPTGPLLIVWTIGACSYFTECFEVARGKVALASGATLAQTVRWEAKGVGDFKICAWAELIGKRDADWSNNERTTTTWIAIGNTGEGFAPGQDDDFTYWWCW